MVKKVCIARLRSGINYKEPLEHIMDSFCELLKDFIIKHPEYEYTYYNFGFNQKPVRDLKALEEADVIIIPSEAEFVYHIKGRLHPGEVKRSNEKVAEAEQFFAGKKIINLRSDRRDDLELYKKTFPNISFDYSEIDEDDFQNNIHSLKYYFIKERPKPLFDAPFGKDIDFIYWGSDKRKGIDGQESGDVRHIYLKAIKKTPDITGMFIGGFNGFKRDMTWMKMRDLLPYLDRSVSTMCFNWMDKKATTARYVEAIACGIIPFVHVEYDITGKFHEEDWQRIQSPEEAVDKIKKLKYNDASKLFSNVENNFLGQLLPKEYYYETFEEKLNAQL